MRSLTPEQAHNSLNRLEDSIKDIPGARALSKRGAASTLDMLGDWRMRISRGDMEPDALPTRYQHQAGRHGRAHPALYDALVAEERRLRAERGEPTGYGARWYYGRHRED